MYYGIQTHFGQFYRTDMDSASVLKMLDSIQSAGIQLIRDECYWSEVEKVRGVYNFPPQIDFYLQQAKLRGIKVLLILNYNNPLYAPHAGSGVVTDSNRNAFKNYCIQTVTRYSALGVKLFEIWNEPNIPMFWDPIPNANDYKLLLQTVYPAIKQIDSTITVLGCATSPAEGNPSPYINWLNFIQQVWNASGSYFMDGISIHLYRVEKAPENFLSTDIANLRNIIGLDKPIYLSEIGYHTASVWPSLSNQTKANYVTRLFLLGKIYSQLKSIVYYDLKDDGENLTEPEHNFGLMTYHLAPKLSFIAYKTMIGEIVNKGFSNQTISGNNYKLKFLSSSENTFALWSKSGVSIQSEIFSTNRLRITNQNGNTYFVYRKNKRLDAVYSEDVNFISEISYFPPIQSLQIKPGVDTIVVGQKVNLSLIGLTFNQKKIFIDSLAVNWSVLDSLGMIDSTGKYTALKIGHSKVKASFEGITVTKNLFIAQSYSTIELEPFNSTSYFKTSYFNMNPNSSIAVIDTNFTTPPKSLKIYYDFQFIALDKHRVIFDCNYNLLGEPDSLYLDVFNNGEGHVIGIQVEDADGEMFSINSLQSQLNSYHGWKTVAISLNKFGTNFNFPARLKRIIFYVVKSYGVIGQNYSGNVLLDNLKIHNGLTGTGEKKQQYLLKSINLSQNYPNPFNPNTIIKYSVTERNQVSIKVFDVLGNEISTLVNREHEPGNFQVEFEADNLNNLNLSSGIYFYRLQSGSYIETKKMILLR
jgi:hypothetical protein